MFFMTLIIRPAEGYDVAGMATIRAQEWESQRYWEKRISGYLAGEHHPQQALPERAAFVAEKDDTIVGFVAGHRTRRFACDAELEWINVAAAYRGQGTAGRLLVRMLAWFVEQEAFRVCVNVAPENIPASRLYARYGAQALQQYWMVWPDLRSVVSQTA